MPPKNKNKLLLSSDLKDPLNKYMATLREFVVLYR